jgi:apolipoprotein N-acyltransferase
VQPDPAGQAADYRPFGRALNNGGTPPAYNPAVLLNFLLALLAAVLLVLSFPCSTPELHPRLPLVFKEQVGALKTTNTLPPPPAVTTTPTPSPSPAAPGGETVDATGVAGVTLNPPAAAPAQKAHRAPRPLTIPAWPARGEYAQYPWLAFLALWPLLLVAWRSTPRAAFGWGYFAGTLWLALHLDWIGSFGAVPVVLLSAFFALPVGLFTYIAHWVIASRRASWIVWGLPSLWTALEYLRSFGFWAFPWNLLGYSQSGNLPLLQIAEWGGVFAVSWAISLASVSLFLLFCPLEGRPQRRRLHLTYREEPGDTLVERRPDHDWAHARRQRCGHALCGVAVLLLLHGYGAVRLMMLDAVKPAPALRVGLVQGGMETKESWSAAGVFERALQAYVVPSRAALVGWQAQHPPDAVWQPLPVGSRLAPRSGSSSGDVARQVEAARSARLRQATALPVAGRPADRTPEAAPSAPSEPPRPTGIPLGRPVPLDLRTAPATGAPAEAGPAAVAEGRAMAIPPDQRRPGKTAAPSAPPGEQTGADSPFSRPAQPQQPPPPPPSDAAHPAYLLVWPESCIPRLVYPPVSGSIPGEVNGLLQGQPGAGLLYGAAGDAHDMQHYENGAILLDGHNPAQWVYSKIRLVTYGEVVPFRGLVRFLEYPWGDQDISEGRTIHPFEFAGHKLATIICFDNLFGFVTRRAASEGAEGLLLITNNSWYDLPSGIRQHCDMDILRAVETRRALGRAATTGWSQLVLPSGRIADTSQLKAQAIVEQWMPLSKQLSVYTSIGDTFAQLCLLVAVVLSLRVLLVGRSEAFL